MSVVAKSVTQDIPVHGREDLIPVADRIQKFSKMLDELSSLSEKKKELWKEIYGNALTDRNNSLICYNHLLSESINSSVNHAIHAQSIAKYIERMSRANDQLLKLAELIASAEAAEEKINSDDIYSALEDEKE